MKFTKEDRMCFSKRRYPNQDKATTSIVKINAKYPPAPAERPLRPYECPVCRGWHLTRL